VFRDDDSSADNCARYCATHCANFALRNSAFRRALFVGAGD
jgi:hypothetical protein